VGNPPATVAWSVALDPTVIVEDGLIVVDIVGDAFRSENGSQVDAPLLFASPLYVTLKLKEPAGCGITPEESGTAPFVTLIGLPTGVPVPAQLLVEKIAYVAEPPGENPPVRVAVS